MAETSGFIPGSGFISKERRILDGDTQGEEGKSCPLYGTVNSRLRRTQYNLTSGFALYYWKKAYAMSRVSRLLTLSI